MKYIKKFESKTKRDILKDKIDMINEYIPGMYIISKFTRYSWTKKSNVNFLILSQVISYQKGAYLMVDANILKSRIIDYVYDFEELDTLLDKKDDMMTLFIKKDNFEKIYETTSLKDAVNKYDEIKKSEPYKTWEINRDTEKYNL